MRDDPELLDRVRGAGFAVVDVETTGLSARSSHIVEVAIVTLDAVAHPVAEWSTLVRPPGDGPIGASHIHGITRADLADAPTFEECADAIVARLAGHLVAGHVVAFDLAHLSAEFAAADRPLPDLRALSVCTRTLARASGLAAPFTLEHCCDQLGIPLHDAHSALGDARAAAAMLERLGARLEPGAARRRLIEEVRWPAPRDVGPWRPKARTSVDS